MSKHTPAPWSLFGNGHCIKGKLNDGEAGIAICSMQARTPEENAANAACIVKVMNAHDRLVEALTDLEVWASGCDEDTPDELIKARAILAEVKS